MKARVNAGFILLCLDSHALWNDNSIQVANSGTKPMIETIIRVAKAESALAASISASSTAGAGKGARRLKKLVIAKRRLARKMLSGAASIRATSRRPPLMHGHKGAKDDCDESN